MPPEKLNTLIDETCKLHRINMIKAGRTVGDLIQAAEKEINNFLDVNAQICVSVATTHNSDFTDWMATIVYIPKSPK